jgi:hypothetical protein
MLNGPADGIYIIIEVSIDINIKDKSITPVEK